MWRILWGELLTYKTREPGPYCPDKGQAQITCRPFEVAFVVAFVAMVDALRATRWFSVSSEGGESAGIAPRLCPKRWLDNGMQWTI